MHLSVAGSVRLDLGGVLSVCPSAGISPCSALHPLTSRVITESVAVSVAAHSELLTLAMLLQPAIACVLLQPLICGCSLLWRQKTRLRAGSPVNWAPVLCR